MKNKKHKYLSELFPDRLPFPFCGRGYAKFDSRDTYNMDFTLVAWLYERLRYFQDEASKTIDFDQPLGIFGEQVLIDGKEVTLRQCIDRMVEDCKVILLFDNGVDFDDYKAEHQYVLSVVDPAKDDLFKVLSKVYWSMWW